MQIKSKYAWLKHLDFMIVDLIALFLSFFVSYALKFDRWDFWIEETWTRFVLIISLLNLVIAFFINPYSGIFRRSYYQEVMKAFQLALFNFVFATLVFYLFKIGDRYSREVTLYMYTIYFVLSLILKYIWKKLLISGKVVIYSTKKIPLFVIAERKTAETTIRNVTAGDFQLYDIKGIHLIDENSVDDNVDNKVVKGPIEVIIEEYKQKIPVIAGDYLKFILDNNIAEVLVSVNPNALSVEVYRSLTANGVGLNMVIENTIGFQAEDQYIQNFGVYRTLSVGTFTFTPGQMFYLAVKRIVDIICGLIGMIVLVPISIIVKIVYLLSADKAPIFYSQTRVGQDGRLIKIKKFRSMVPNADEILQSMLKEEKWRKQWAENQKFDNDPRITKIGRILRKTSIDELPQLINVLKGDMSIVGPRPLVVGELEQHGGLKLYQKVKPGITGWWACNGRSNIDYRERLELEYYYVKHCSLHLDLICIFRTILAVVKKDGAQ